MLMNMENADIISKGNKRLLIAENRIRDSFYKAIRKRLQVSIQLYFHGQGTFRPKPPNVYCGACVQRSEWVKYLCDVSDALAKQHYKDAYDHDLDINVVLGYRCHMGCSNLVFTIYDAISEINWYVFLGQMSVDGGSQGETELQYLAKKYDITTLSADEEDLLSNQCKLYLANQKKYVSDSLHGELSFAAGSRPVRAGLLRDLNDEPFNLALVKQVKGGYPVDYTLTPSELACAIVLTRELARSQLNEWYTANDLRGPSPTQFIEACKTRSVTPLDAVEIPSALKSGVAMVQNLGEENEQQDLIINYQEFLKMFARWEMGQPETVRLVFGKLTARANPDVLLDAAIKFINSILQDKDDKIIMDGYVKGSVPYYDTKDAESGTCAQLRSILEKHLAKSSI